MKRAFLEATRNLSQFAPPAWLRAAPPAWGGVRVNTDRQVSGVDRQTHSKRHGVHRITLWPPPPPTPLPQTVCRCHGSFRAMAWRAEQQDAAWLMQFRSRCQSFWKERLWWRVSERWGPGVCVCVSFLLAKRKSFLFIDPFQGGPLQMLCDATCCDGLWLWRNSPWKLKWKKNINP